MGENKNVTRKDTGLEYLYQYLLTWEECCTTLLKFSMQYEDDRDTKTDQLLILEKIEPCEIGYLLNLFQYQKLSNSIQSCKQ